MYQFLRLLTIFFLLLASLIFSARFNSYLLPEGEFPHIGVTEYGTIGPPNPPVECVSLFGSLSELDCSFTLSLPTSAEWRIREMNGEGKLFTPHGQGLLLGSVWAHEIISVRF